MFSGHKKTISLKFFKEIEGRVTKNLCQEFSRTKNRISGELSRLDYFFLNPLIQGHCGAAPEPSQNVYGTNQGTNEDDSESDPHPEASVSQSQTTQSSGPEDGHDKQTNELSKTSCFCFGSSKVV